MSEDQAGPTHAQPSAGPDAATQALVKRGADLAKRNMALWSWSVRRQDQLVADGMDRAAAHRQSLDEAGQQEAAPPSRS